MCFLQLCSFRSEQTSFEVLHCTSIGIGKNLEVHAATACMSNASVDLYLNETGKNLGVRRRYPPVLNDARYTGPVAH
jgi:peroxiredoxin